jgi:dolichol-phosphate mannosyltransferase
MISVIVPTYNEGENIVDLIKGVPKKIGKEKVEIIVADGNSSDSTIKNAKKAGAKVIVSADTTRGLKKEDIKVNEVEVVEVSSRGKWCDAKIGARRAKGDKLVFIDGDGEYPPSYIPYAIELLKDCEMAIPYMYLKRDKTELSRLIALRMTRSFMKLIFLNPLGMKDVWMGFRAIKKDDWMRIEPKEDGFVADVEIDINAVEKGFRIIQFPMIREMRAHGKSKFIVPYRPSSYLPFIQQTKYMLSRRKDVVNKKKKVKIIEYHE